MSLLNGHSQSFWLGIWRTVLSALLVAAILGAIHVGTQLSALETTVGSLDRTIQELKGRITWLERRRETRP